MLPSESMSSSRGSICKWNILDMLEPCIHLAVLSIVLRKHKSRFVSSLLQPRSAVKDGMQR